MNEPEDPGGAPPVEVDDEQSVPVEAGRLADAGRAIMRRLGVPHDAALTVTLVDPARMAELKEQALGERRPTDVLSFPIDDPDDPMPGPLVLGDVVICPAVAGRQARALGRPLADELEELLAHGILHLRGRDHADPSAELAMAAEQRELIAWLRGGAR